MFHNPKFIGFVEQIFQEQTVLEISRTFTEFLETLPTIHPIISTEVFQVVSQGILSIKCSAVLSKICP